MTDAAALLSFFDREGYAELPRMDEAAARELFRRAQDLHPLDQSIFLTEEAWENSAKSHYKTNPGPGNNALEKVAAGGYDPIAFVRDNADFNVVMTELLGRNFKWVYGKFVCRLAPSALPEWLMRRIDGRPANTLGAFMHPQFRDFTYLLDTDLHQDIVDFLRMPEATRDHRFITLYVYLNDVGEQEAPITMLPGSHRFGATPYQHDVTHDAATGAWLYRDQGRVMVTSLKDLKGPAGYAAFWHSSMLHGSDRPPGNGRLRISLRFLLARSDNPAPCFMDKVNEHVQGPLFLNTDFTPGYNADKDGFWNLRMTDYMKRGAA